MAGMQGTPSRSSLRKQRTIATDACRRKGNRLRLLTASARRMGPCFRREDCGKGRAMSETRTLSHRIDALEAKLMFQDEAIETLNRTITEQWIRIDALTRQVLL